MLMCSDHIAGQRMYAAGSNGIFFLQVNITLCLTGEENILSFFISCGEVHCQFVEITQKTMVMFRKTKEVNRWIVEIYLLSLSI